MITKFKATLRDSGRSVTTARILLFEYLEAHGLVKTTQFIDDNLHIADRASLYRTLDMFKKVGIIEEQMLAGKRAVELTDTFDSHHHHLTCGNCGKSVAITLPQIEDELTNISAVHGYAIKRHVVEIEGVCPACQNLKSVV